MAESKAEVELQFRTRRLVIEGLQLVPQWMIGSIAWYIFSKMVLDKLTEKEPGTEINAAIIASDVAGVSFPPGVALAAQIDVTLTGMKIIPDIFQAPEVSLFWIERQAVAIQKFFGVYRES